MYFRYYHNEIQLLPVWKKCRKEKQKLQTKAKTWNDTREQTNQQYWIKITIKSSFPEILIISVTHMVEEYGGLAYTIQTSASDV